MSPERPTAVPIEVDPRTQTPPRQNSQQSAMNQVDGQSRQGGSWNLNHQGQLDSSSHKVPEGLLPAFSAKQYSQLPTPQSPSDSTRLPAAIRFPPESPVPQSQASSGSYPQRLSYRSSQEEAPTPSSTSHILTPASSPFNPRNTSSRNENPATPSNQSSRASSTSRLYSIDSMLNAPANPKNPHSAQPTSSSSEMAEQSAPPSTLSSPFVAKATIPRTPSRQSIPTRDVPFPTTGPSSQRIPSQPSTSTFDVPMRAPGGEMERIRQAMRENHLSQLQEAESRRPEYLKRAKRSLEEADPDALNEDSRELLTKARRLKLFQETSEESFEESLMAGGYGRYRTADWVRQPQPISLPVGVAALPVSTPVVTPPEQPKEEPQPAHREGAQEATTPGCLQERPIRREVESQILPQAIGEESGSSAKKRGTRKKKKGVDLASMDNKAFAEAAAALAAEDMLDKPNWPDAEFPWRLRMEEREESAKADEEERLKWIERFLDRDSDDDEPDGPPTSSAADVESDSEALPSDQWESNALQTRRGKMVPLLAHPEDPRKARRIKRSAFPSDPGDAKAALLAKRSVRALSYRKERRERELRDEDSDEELCICGGVDDGRPLVQCDGCQTWYHLWCLGISDIRVLGREEDPCRSPSSEPDFAPMREPTFAPTDDAPRERSVDTTFFPSVQESPIWIRNAPRTPTRSSQHLPPGEHWYSSSSGSWPEIFRGPPSTPESREHHVRIYTPGGNDSSRPGFDESPFDPASTPSRGIRFPRSFATPKFAVWPRSNSGPQTPQRADKRSNRGSFGGPGSLAATLEDNGPRPFSSISADAYSF
ncbi:hypothetical protein BKA70DRAFT_1382490 [Coprinopsis sp. MPI-PUGE-AT-0042]|nr:hypothetical protein BKA70DRAFT_1382490 [Coprinopsis sp. MPI-PUGE-AT-0042]